MSDAELDRIVRAIRRAADSVPPIDLGEVMSRGPIDLDNGHGEPVTDDGVVPRAVSETRSGPVVIDLERTNEASTSAGAPPQRRRSWPLLAAAAGLVVVVAVVGLATTGDDGRLETAPAGPAERTELARATEQVDDFLAVYNADDPDALDDAMVSNMLTEGHRADVKTTFDAAGEQWERVGPCRLDGGTGVVCPIRRTDDFHGTAGLAIEEDYVFRFKDDGRVTRFTFLDAMPWAEQWAFRAEFRNWVAANHPDADIDFFGGHGTTSYELVDLPRAHSMGSALELVDDFVASSDRWPI